MQPSSRALIPKAKFGLSRGAFRDAPTRNIGRDAPLFHSAERGALLIRSGFVCRSCTLPDGRRAILDVLVSGDIAGLDQIVMTNSDHEITAAGRVSGSFLSAETLHDLMADRSACVRLITLFAEARSRMDRIATMLGRFDARALGLARPP